MDFVRDNPGEPVPEETQFNKEIKFHLLKPFGGRLIPIPNVIRMLLY